MVFPRGSGFGELLLGFGKRFIPACAGNRRNRELHAAIDEARLRLINLCVWEKADGGMGSLYRSQHELVAVLKNGTTPHINNVELGRHGRYRANVWSYPGANPFRKGRDQDLADHPTVKPVAMIADAIKDCSNRGHVVLDPPATRARPCWRPSGPAGVPG